MPIKKLIQEIKEGNTVSERKLYEFCYRHCYKVARLYCDDEDEATAIFNYSMLDVFRSLNKVKDYQGFVSWVNHIVKNDCIDHLRKKSVYRNKLIALESNQFVSNTFNEAISQLNMESVFSLIQGLKPNYRLCFVMSVIEGYKGYEIAKKLGINENTIKWYISESKKILRTKLRERGYNYPNKKRHHGVEG